MVCPRRRGNKGELGVARVSHSKPQKYTCVRSCFCRGPHLLSQAHQCIGDQAGKSPADVTPCVRTASARTAQT
ncbi:hypothetical protein NDU88_001411 [Pleurodeles waltl]|uniref:Uncharacterized protein n=1 Tax=Pleurodeles waltl TaxID=8319 RepID=A0AAV7UA84_PLEWA|nr:hypothetical protein NDU88_001411 [Pleurodeles waltl]